MPDDLSLSLTHPDDMAYVAVNGARQEFLAEQDLAGRQDFSGNQEFSGHQDLSMRQDLVVRYDLSGHAAHPAETLRLVRDAADKIESLQLDVMNISSKARELIRRTNEERIRAKADLQTVRLEAEIWHRRALEAEAIIQNTKLMIWDQKMRLEEAEAREQQANQRAELADLRYKRIEDVLVRVSSRFAEQMSR